MNRSAWEVTAQINFDEPPEEEFNITVKKLVLPVKPRGVLAE